MNKDLKYLDSKKQKEIEIFKRIKHDLTTSKCNTNFEKGKLNFIEYKNLTDWSIKQFYIESSNLKKLAEKIEYVVNVKRNPQDILIMLKAILRGTKKLYKPCKKEYKGELHHVQKECLGIGHFRYGTHEVITLSREELDFIKKYFEL